MEISVDELLEFDPPPIVTEEEARKTAKFALQSASGFGEAYCRGNPEANHIDSAGNYRPGVRSVVLMAAAQIMAKPGQVQKRDQTGAVSYLRGEGFKGFTLGELQCLNRYRKTAK
ncbi:hypothetical protein CENDO_04070 [Corynebacterium endometrii]|uniref:Uncharacterized protein n=1 Tax=Corynebacterium endometrii TaxID=2488819 RepID=A0A4P7QEQ0_9CORY|nr:hypothetical protein CENDO_04070 [Corynebacterium endometrii]